MLHTTLTRVDCWVLWRWLQIVGDGFPMVVEEVILEKFGGLVPVKESPSWHVLAVACEWYPFLRDKTDFSRTETLKVLRVLAQEQLGLLLEELCRQVDVIRSLLLCLYRDEQNRRTLPHLSAMFYYTYKCLRGRLPEDSRLKEMNLQQMLLGWQELQAAGSEPDVLFSKEGLIRRAACWKEWHRRWPDDEVFASSETLKREIYRWLDGMLTYPHLRYWKDYDDWVEAALQELLDSALLP